MVCCLARNLQFSGQRFIFSHPENKYIDLTLVNV